jgi:hypothetical protein
MRHVELFKTMIRPICDCDESRPRCHVFARCCNRLQLSLTYRKDTADGFGGDLPYLIFMSRRELGTRQMLVRKALHLWFYRRCFVFRRSLGWVSLDSAGQIAAFLIAGLACTSLGADGVYRDKN